MFKALIGILLGAVCATSILLVPKLSGPTVSGVVVLEDCSGNIAGGVVTLSNGSWIAANEDETDLRGTAKLTTEQLNDALMHAKKLPKDAVLTITVGSCSGL